MSFKIAFVIPYFGELPIWINFFVESCRSNASIKWFLFNDQPAPANSAPNFIHIRTTFGEYCELLSRALDQQVSVKTPYKLCDIRPALPFVHSDMLDGFDFVATGDIDVIYGNIRHFYHDELLSQYDVFSSHRDRISGHLCLMRNRADVITAFQHAPNWKRALSIAEYVGFDETAFFNVFCPTKRWLGGRSKVPSVRTFFREAYSTPAATQSMRWYWREGRLTNEYYPTQEFMYLHFMSWHNDRWLAYQPEAAAKARAPWQRLGQVVQMDWRLARKNGFMISPMGIGPVEPARYS